MSDQVSEPLAEVNSAILIQNPKLKRAVNLYTAVQKLFPTVDVSDSRDFQRKFNDYYKVIRRSQDWYRQFYTAFQTFRFQEDVSYPAIVGRLQVDTKKIESSFSSKILATLKTEMPVLDSVVLKRLGLRLPYYYRKDRIGETCQLYEQLMVKMNNLTESREGQRAAAEFDKAFPDAKVTTIKKLDFILWNGLER